MFLARARFFTVNYVHVINSVHVVNLVHVIGLGERTKKRYYLFGSAANYVHLLICRTLLICYMLLGCGKGPSSDYVLLWGSPRELRVINLEKRTEEVLFLVWGPILPLWCTLVIWCTLLGWRGPRRYYFFGSITFFHGEVRARL